MGSARFAWGCAFAITALGTDPCAAEIDAGALDITSEVDSRAPPPYTWSGGPSLHALLGGQGTLPGGTQALGDSTTAMSLMFEHPDVIGPAGIAIRYLNEGFLGPQNEPWNLRLRSPLHYRDSFSVLFDRWLPVSSDCRLGAALGPETYFDTTAKDYRWNYGDRHGLGLQAGVLGQCHLSARISVEMMASRSIDVASFDSTAVAVGLVYAPGRDTEPESADSQDRPFPRSRVEISYGIVDIDDFDESHDDGKVVWLAYDHPFNDIWGADVSVLRERVDGALDRRGVAGLLTAQHRFLAPWLQFFAGLGPYLAQTDDLGKSSDRQVNLLLAYGFRISLVRRFSLAVKLGRVGASRGKTDADLITVGVGYDLR